MRALALTLTLLAAPALADVAGVASVIDGDTIEVHGQRIRLHGIDAPESRKLCRLNGNPWQCGKDAANALADKIVRRPVTCEDLGEWMVANGWAVAYYLYSYEYSRAEHRAKMARRGAI